MPVLTVLTNSQGDVLGSVRTDVAGQGPGLPGQARVVARPGQRLIQIEVDDDVLKLDPSALHEFIKANYLRSTSEAPRNESDLVRTPAGPMPAEAVHAVGPGETVTRDPDGDYKITPRKGTEAPS
jgi:hypothetical protein